ncbi:MAG: alpha/beta fold hydrolase [Xanthomonadales bacterium]|jgi:pimeloyl-ACP methyl ester carboxylesterase|nr:alpha/beta fold hydrolase [Xanthomonadales bacterium]
MAEPAPPLLVLLLHGYARTRRDMASLAVAIDAAGHRPLAVPLPTTFGRLDDCLAALRQTALPAIRQQLAAGGAYALVGHSFGGLIARHGLARGLPQPAALLTIATPHQGSELADLALRWPALGRILPPLDCLQTGTQTPCFDPPRAFRIGAIAGDHAAPPGGLLLHGPNDGRVTVASALPLDADCSCILPLDHHRIHHHASTLQAVCRFLGGGRLSLPRPT